MILASGAEQTWPSWAEVRRNPTLLLATGGGSGLLRPAPGTWGSLAATGVLFTVYAAVPFWVQVALAILLCAAGIHISAKAALHWRVHDHPAIVIDEWAGMSIAMLGLPPLLIAGGEAHWPAVLLALLLFRYFDIVKPGPIGWIDRSFSGGLGIMLDDIVAGVFALIGVQAAFFAMTAVT